MTKARLEAFSDGVMAILITIMVLELGVPHGADLEALAPLGPVFLSYVLSFLNLGIYWNNHHHLLQAAHRVDGRVLAYFILVRALIAREGRDSVLAQAVGSDRKGKVSPLLYAVAIPIALVTPWVSFAIYVVVAMIWFVPDLRIERRIAE